MLSHFKEKYKYDNSGNQKNVVITGENEVLLWKRLRRELCKNNSSSRYMEDTRKRYILTSNNESLQALIENQEEELTIVLIELK